MFDLDEFRFLLVVIAIILTIIWLKSGWSRFGTPPLPPGPWRFPILGDVLMYWKMTMRACSVPVFALAFAHVCMRVLCACVCTRVRSCVLPCEHMQTMTKTKKIYVNVKSWSAPLFHERMSLWWKILENWLWNFCFGQKLYENSMQYYKMFCCRVLMKWITDYFFSKRVTFIKKLFVNRER